LKSQYIKKFGLGELMKSNGKIDDNSSPTPKEKTPMSNKSLDFLSNSLSTINQAFGVDKSFKAKGEHNQIATQALFNS